MALGRETLTIIGESLFFAIIRFGLLNLYMQYLVALALLDEWDIGF